MNCTVWFIGTPRDLSGTPKDPNNTYTLQDHRGAKWSKEFV